MSLMLKDGRLNIKQGSVQMKLELLKQTKIDLKQKQ